MPERNVENLAAVLHGKNDLRVVSNKTQCGTSYYNALTGEMANAEAESPRYKIAICVVCVVVGNN